MKGEWHEDPRFKGSLYLVCEKEEEKKEDTKGGEKGKQKGGKKAKKAEVEEKDDDGESKKCTCQK